MINNVKKILVIRADRIGEFVLTLPVIAALKEMFPHADISVMVKPEVKPLIEDNPNVSEVIEYQKIMDGIAEAFRLARIFRGKEFDIVVVVNPKKEFHLAVFLAGIRVRAGFDRKWGFLLTHKVKDLKYPAQKHEVEYNLDLVRALGIEPKNVKPLLIMRDVTIEMEYKLKKAIPAGSDTCRLIAIHPCTSNPKKQWPKEYFANLSDLLIKKGYNTVIISGIAEGPCAKETIALMKAKPIDLAGALTLRELVELLKRCGLLVSCDSGPVHIAAAAGTPVVALFGSQDPGGKPIRWAPYGSGHAVIYKNRVEDITPVEVFEAAEKLLKKNP